MERASSDLDAPARAERLQRLLEIGLALGRERDPDRLLEQILEAARTLCSAEGGSFYLVSEDGSRLEFAVLRNARLGFAFGGASGQPLPDQPPLPLWHDGEPNLANVATWVVHRRAPLNLPDAYQASGFDFSGTRIFDAHNAYRSRSFLTVPLCSRDGEVIGVLQLINACDDAGAVTPFGDADQAVVEALAAQAGLALENRQLLAAQRLLLESFIQLIAQAIDAKSPYTGGHCERVPVITEMLAQAACDADAGPFREFRLSDEEWYELHIAAWLHDCGKVTTPVHVMDKATKLEGIHDRIDQIALRFGILRRELQLDHLRAGGSPEAPELQATLAELDEELAFLRRCNTGGEFMAADDQDRVRRIATRGWQSDTGWQPLLSQEEVDLLCIPRGTLSEDERLVINGHMVQTLRMLEQLPFPRDLRRVPEYAGGHHEKMDGSGYPRGLFAGDMSIPARIMAVADVFEALTATDRPYKPARTLSETMTIMGYMKRDNHLDPDLFDLFVTSGVYRRYADRYLAPELIDAVDEAALLAIEPNDFSLPDAETRQARWRDFLPQYRAL